MSSRARKRHPNIEAEIEANAGYEVEPISASAKTYPISDRNPAEQQYFLVDNVDYLYNPDVFYPDGDLINCLISKGLSEDQARDALPAADEALSQICAAFKKAATPLDPNLPTQLPERAPELFRPSRGRPKKGAEDIVSFLQRVWKPWIDAGLLTRTDLKRLDPAAYLAVKNQLYAGELPQGVRVPTLGDTYEECVPAGIASIVRHADLKMVRAIRALAERRLRDIA